MVSSRSCTFAFSSGAVRATPALFTRRSRSPASDSSASLSAGALAASAISGCTQSLPKSFRQLTASVSRSSSVLATATTSAPSRASARTISRPMPRPAPVTRALLPEKRIAAAAAAVVAIALPGSSRAGARDGREGSRPGGQQRPAGSARAAARRSSVRARRHPPRQSIVVINFSTWECSGTIGLILGDGARF